jgi:hypothetical protein
LRITVLGPVQRSCTPIISCQSRGWGCAGDVASGSNGAATFPIFWRLAGQSSVQGATVSGIQRPRGTSDEQA